jgi:hypothetical protein
MSGKLDFLMKEALEEKTKGNSGTFKCTGPHPVFGNVSSNYLPLFRNMQKRIIFF